MNWSSQAVWDFVGITEVIREHWSYTPMACGSSWLELSEVLCSTTGNRKNHCYATPRVRGLWLQWCIKLDAGTSSCRNCTCEACLWKFFLCSFSEFFLRLAQQWCYAMLSFFFGDSFLTCLLKNQYEFKIRI